MTSIFALLCCLSTAGVDHDCRINSVHPEQRACADQRNRLVPDEYTCRCVEFHSGSLCRPQGLLLSPPSITGGGTVGRVLGSPSLSAPVSAH